MVNNLIKPRSIGVRLTDRERQLLQLNGDGKSPKQIAEELGIKEDTVKKSLKVIREKQEVGAE